MSLELMEYLVEQGLLSRQEAETAAEVVRSNGESLASYLLRTTAASRAGLTEAIEEAYGAPRVFPALLEPDRLALGLVPEETARRLCVIPLIHVEGRLGVAMQDPLDLAASDFLRASTGLEIEPLLATREEILGALSQYGGAEDLSDMVVSAPEEGGAEPQDIGEALLTEAEERPAVRLVHLMLRHAVTSGASDIHLEPQERKLSLRYRIDGVLYDAPAPPLALARAIISRIKILADLDIAERRLPQDGRCVMRYQGREVDLRVSILPSMYGEGVVIRLLDRGKTQLKLEELGMDSYLLEKLNRCVRKPNGIFLVTGPTGSGKSTTLYSVLERLRSPHRKIITLEDPVEYSLEGIFQVPVRHEINLTFATCLRSVLRHDPDIIMVGEIRDSETAEMAVRAAMTGHLVLSTLHTNDARSAVTRLVDLGVPPYLVAETLRGAQAQRLVRLLCPECKVPTRPDPAVLRRLDPDLGPLEQTLYTARPGGCSHCNNLGYKGRIGLFEILEIDNVTRQELLLAAGDEEFKRKVYQQEYRTLQQDGLHKVVQGQTTLDEVVAATLGA
jgi:type IV pilus assembly protein PilB